MEVVSGRNGQIPDLQFQVNRSLLVSVTEENPGAARLFWGWSSSLLWARFQWKQMCAF